MATTSLTPFDDAFWRDDRALAFAPGCEESGVPEPPGDRVAGGLVCFRTSGSEGRPRWVGLSRAALLASARAVNAFLGLAGSDVWMRVLPCSHVGGFGVETRAWVGGVRLVRDDGKWHPARFVETCAREGVTLTSLVPTQVFDLVQAGLVAPLSLRGVVVGGGELRPGLWQRGCALGWPLLTSYGLTEAASQVATLSPGEPDPTRLTLLCHWEAAVSPDGCLVLRGPALATCYLGQNDQARWFRDEIDGQLATADRVAIGTTSGGRTLQFFGRRDRVVKIRGELVDLNAVEALIADAAVERSVFGLVRLRSESDERAGHRLVLECLNRSAGLSVSDLVDRRLPAWARLAEVRVVDDLHLSALGKPVL